MAEHKVGRAITVGNHAGLDNSMGNGGRNGTGEVGSMVGAGVGNDNGTELKGGGGIVCGLEIGTGIFVGDGVGAVGGVWL